MSGRVEAQGTSMVKGLFRLNRIQSIPLRRFLKDKAAVISLIVIVLIILSAVFAGTISKHDPITVNPGNSMAPPSWDHPLGTDHLGRDMLARILYGGRASLLVGVLAVVIGLVFGGALGIIAGFFRWADNLVMRSMDVLMAFPYVLRAMAIVAILGPGLYKAIIAIGIGTIPIFARLVRSCLLTIREKEYFQAGRAIGASNLRLITKYVIPNILPTILTYATLQLAQAILAVSMLSFLSLGVTPPTPEWGYMVSSGREFLRTEPQLIFYPSFAIFLVVLCLNILGDGLRDAWDPSMNKQ